jgi:hypothetical protein
MFLNLYFRRRKSLQCSWFALLGQTQGEINSDEGRVFLPVQLQRGQLHSGRPGHQRVVLGFQPAVGPKGVP